MAAVQIDSLVLILLLLYSALSFFLTLRKPKIGLFVTIPIIGLGFEESGIIKGSFIVLISVAIVLNTFLTKKTLRINSKVRFLLSIVGIYLVWVLVRGIFVEHNIWFWLYWIARRIAAPLLIALLMLFLIHKKADLIKFCYAVVAFIFITSVIGVLQYFNVSNIFWRMREVLGIDESIGYQVHGRVRIPGLASYVVPLSYQLLSAVPLLMALVLSRLKLAAPKGITALALIIVSLCLVLTFMRAAILGSFLGSVIVFVWMFRSKITDYWTPLFVLLVGLCLLFLVFFQEHPRKEILKLGGTYYERIPVFLVASKVLAANPIGVGYHYLEEAAEFYPTVFHLARSEAVLWAFPHNIFLTIGVTLGFPAILLITIFYFYIIKYLYQASKTGDKAYKVLSIGILGTFVSYLTNAMFHNASPFFADPFNWFFIGIALVVINTYRAEAYAKTATS